MQLRCGFNLGPQIGRCPQQEPALAILRNRNLSLSACLTVKSPGTHRTAIYAQTIPLRKSAAGSRTPNLHAHPASLPRRRDGTYGVRGSGFGLLLRAWARHAKRSAEA